MPLFSFLLCGGHRELPLFSWLLSAATQAVGWGNRVHVSTCSLTGSVATGFCRHYLCESFSFVLLKEKRKAKQVNLHVSAVQSDEGEGTGVTQGYFTSLKHSSALCLAAPYPLRTQLTFTSFLNGIPSSGATSASWQPWVHCVCLGGPTDAVLSPAPWTVPPRRRVQPAVRRRLTRVDSSSSHPHHANRAAFGFSKWKTVLVVSRNTSVTSSETSSPGVYLPQLQWKSISEGFKWMIKRKSNSGFSAKVQNRNMTIPVYIHILFCFDFLKNSTKVLI